MTRLLPFCILFFATTAYGIPLNLNYVMTEEDPHFIFALGPLVQASVDGSMTLNTAPTNSSDWVVTVNTTTPVDRSTVSVTNFTLDFLDEPYVFTDPVPRGFGDPVDLTVNITSATYAFGNFARPLALDLRFQQLNLPASLTLIGTILLDGVSTPFNVTSNDPILRVDGVFDPDFTRRSSKLTLDFFGASVAPDVVSQVVDGETINVSLGFITAFNVDPFPADIVPEPGTAILMATGLMGLLAYGRRR